MVGVSIPVGTRLDTLEAELQYAVADGYDAAELNLLSCPLIAGGKLVEPVAAYLGEVLAKYPLRYTAHAGYGMNLRDLQDQQLQREVLFSSIDACAQLDLGPLNIHYEEYSSNRREEQAFLTNLRAACDYGQLREVAVNVENLEVEDVRYVLDAIHTLNHPNCGMTVDLGHLYLSARHFGYDFMTAMRDCAPLARHIHINDNFGVFEPLRLENHLLYDTMDPEFRIAYSRGDIHLPPFWGSVPMGECFAVLKQAGYGGVWMCEYRSALFRPLNRQIQERVRREIEQA